jgi:hypothetical protein
MLGQLVVVGIQLRFVLGSRHSIFPFVGVGCKDYRCRSLRVEDLVGKAVCSNCIHAVFLLSISIKSDKSGHYERIDLAETQNTSIPIRAKVIPGGASQGASTRFCRHHGIRPQVGKNHRRKYSFLSHSESPDLGFLPEY